MTPQVDEDGNEILIPEPEAKNTGPKRTSKQREEDLELVDRMVKQRKKLREIALEISSTRPYTISVQQVFADIRKLEEEAKTRFDVPKPLARAKALDRIEYLEREAIDAWARSQQSAQSTKIEVETGGEGGSKQKTTKTQEKQVGDASFLKILQTLHDMRCKLEGTYAPTRQEVAVGGVSKVDNIDSLREAYNKARDAQMLAKLQLKEKNAT